MCGIVGYVGTKQAFPVLIKGLEALEYRGYDSAGLCIQNGRLHTVRSEGKVISLSEKAQLFSLEGTAGIAHTRWATHGVPEERNAHPHRDCAGRVAIVHNGIIENHHTLRERLQKTGHVFASDTDSEVLAHLVEEALDQGHPLLEAVRVTLRQIQGTYGLAVIAKEIPQTIVVARMGGPLVVGI